MVTSASPTRRQILLGVGAGAGLVLAACASEGGESPEETSTPSPLLPAGTDLAAVDAVPVGSALAVTVDDEPFLVTQPEAGRLLAFSAICTHQGCPVGVGEGELLCPCHQSRYDLATGEVLGGPAPRPLPEVPVEVRDGRVVTT
jgi:Rieske Fe-S protein